MVIESMKAGEEWFVLPFEERKNLIHKVINQYRDLSEAEMLDENHPRFVPGLAALIGDAATSRILEGMGSEGYRSERKRNLFGGE